MSSSAPPVRPPRVGTAPATEPREDAPARSQNQNAARSPFRPASVLSAADVQFPFKTTADATVVFSVLLGAGGQAGKITVLQDVAPFTAAAEESLKNWKFSLASFNSQPKDSEMLVAFVFRHAVYVANPPLFTPIIPAKESAEAAKDRQRHDLHSGRQSFQRFQPRFDRRQAAAIHGSTRAARCRTR